MVASFSFLFFFFGTCASRNPRFLSRTILQSILPRGIFFLRALFSLFLRDNYIRVIKNSEINSRCSFLCFKDNQTFLFHANLSPLNRSESWILNYFWNRKERYEGQFPNFLK